MLRGFIYGLILCAVAAVVAALVFPLSPETESQAAPPPAEATAPEAGEAAAPGEGDEAGEAPEAGTQE
ncbi:MAG: hypothetical protein ACQEUZ_08190 [Pseudomonadota bacterium]